MNKEDDKVEEDEMVREYQGKEVEETDIVETENSIEDSKELEYEVESKEEEEKSIGEPPIISIEKENTP